MGTWLEIGRGVVHPWHHDHFGHMNVRHYAPFFDDAVYHLWTRLGLPYAEMQARFGVHCVTASATTTFVRELTAGDLVVIDGAPVRLGGKSIAFHMRMHHADTGALHATCDVVEVVFDPVARTSAPMPEPLRAALSGRVVTLG